MTATTRKGHRCVALPDTDNRRACMYCGRVDDEGYTGLSVTNLMRGTTYGRNVHDIVCLVPEPVAALDDDEFATVRIS